MKNWVVNVHMDPGERAGDRDRVTSLLALFTCELVHDRRKVELILPSREAAFDRTEISS
jgi:hypothetical protein